jgi:hypothetical protein
MAACLCRGLLKFIALIYAKPRKIRTKELFLDQKGILRFASIYESDCSGRWDENKVLDRGYRVESLGERYLFRKYSGTGCLFMYYVLCRVQCG